MKAAITAGKLAKPSLARRSVPPEAKARMVEMFARFQSVSDVEAMLKKDFGLVLDRRNIEAFNADSRRCAIGKRLRALFDECRKSYVTETAKVGLAHQAHRLRLIEKLIDKATTSKDFSAAIKGLELAAKEMGMGSQQTVKHEGTVGHVHVSIDDARRELAMRLSAMTKGLPVVDTTAKALPNDAPAEVDTPLTP